MKGGQVMPESIPYQAMYSVISNLVICDMIIVHVADECVDLAKCLPLLPRRGWTWGSITSVLPRVSVWVSVIVSGW